MDEERTRPMRMWWYKNGYPDPDEDYEPRPLIRGSGLTQLQRNYWAQVKAESDEAESQFLGRGQVDFHGNPAGYGELMRRNGIYNGQAHMIMRGVTLGGSPAGIMGGSPMRSFWYANED